MFSVDMADLIACYRGLESKTGGFAPCLLTVKTEAQGKEGKDPGLFSPWMVSHKL